MGLDMYLSKKVYVQNWEHTPKEERHQVMVSRGGKPVGRETIDPERVTYVVEEVGYWRKANAIHKWFVENVQHGDDNCGAYYVSAETLRELRKTVEAVQAHPELAPRLLPTQEGFFFGSTEYDEGYFEDLALTKEILDQALANADAEFEYTSSW